MRTGLHPEARPQGRRDHSLEHASLHATEASANAARSSYQGLRGFSTRVYLRTVKAGSVEMTVWAAIVWRRDGTR